MSYGIQQRAADSFALAGGFGLAQLLDSPGAFHRDSNHAPQSFQTLPGWAFTQDAQGANGSHTHHQRDQTYSLLFNSLNVPLPRGDAQHFVADLLAASAGVVDAGSGVDQQGRALSKERGCNNPRDRIQQVEDIIGREQLPAKVVQTLHFDPLILGLFRLIPRTVGKPAGQDRSNQESTERNPVLRICDGEFPNRGKKEKIDRQGSED